MMPGAYPGLGHLAQFARDPLAFFTRLRDHGDITAWRLGPKKSVFVHRPENVKQVLLSVEKEFSTGDDAGYAFGLFAGNGIINTSGPFWRRQRKMMQPGMRPGRIAGYAATMVELTDELTEDLARSCSSGQTRDVRVDMLALTQKIAAKTLFGADVTGDAAAVGRALDVAAREIGAEFRGVTMFLPNWLPTPGRARLKKAITAVEQVLYRIIDERTAAHAAGPAHRTNDRPDDMLQLLMDARDEAGEPMSARQLRDETMTLYIAGHETTGNTLVWAYHLLSQHPEVFDRMAAEIDEVVGDRLPIMDDYSQLKYTEGVVKETLRLYPAAWLLMFTAKADVEIDGYHVEAGTDVWMSQWATHRDPRWFPEADRFRPERWVGDAASDIPSHAWFPFGGGQHVCLGNRFALVEAVLVLATIARRFRIDIDPSLDLPPQPLLTLQPGRNVPARVVLRSQADHLPA
ncbi:cytochrome P450 [Nocardioides okcheonensis]|uniref:cytochrome P450 n=1 Tax=Nocardioides okcheonensis TaxID=2894081 RepID=UPI001E3C7014|nr:cytochrome P450 [Nocardioides okcheonensis]UFN45174.1 cytochrome P450 [Nocardioides okcheonensis]